MLISLIVAYLKSAIKRFNKQDILLQIKQAAVGTTKMPLSKLSRLQGLELHLKGLKN